MRRGAHTSWIVSGLVLLATLAGLAFVLWPRPIVLSDRRTGDADLLDHIGTPEGHRNLVVTVVDLDAVEPVRRANIGANENTVFEAGSLTKALTGLAIADSVRRGEIRLEDPVAKHLGLQNTAPGAVTLRELATHRGGYPRLGGRTYWAGLATTITAGNPYGAGREQLLAEAAAVDVQNRGAYEYSNLGAAVAGQAVAAAAGLSYADYMQARVFGPLRMTATKIADRPDVARGLTDRGRASEPWVMDGYAPAGGAVTTAADLTKLAQAVLGAKAPGIDALTPIAEGSEPDRRIGLFWIQSRVGERDTLVSWHNGRTGGYSSFVGFDLAQRRAVIVLSDVSRSVDELAVRLLTQER